MAQVIQKFLIKSTQYTVFYRGELPDICKDSLRSAESEDELRRVALHSRNLREMINNTGHLENESQQELFPVINGFQTIKINITASSQTWIEEQFEKHQDKDRLNLSDTRKRIVEEFSQIKREVSANLIPLNTLFSLRKWPVRITT